MTKAVWVVVLLIAGVFAGVWGYMRFFSQETISNFKECAQAGYPVMESYPARCRTPKGQTFTQETPSPTSSQLHPLIRVQAPQSGQGVRSPLVVKGEARGNWFFEASFPIYLQDSSGRRISTAIATAQGQWMTEEFVPFTATVTIPATYRGSATLVLQKDNPSGLPEHDDAISIPITVTGK